MAIIQVVHGKSRARNNGVLNVTTPYLRLPYSLLKSEAFLSLSPKAIKTFMVLLRHWATHDPDQPIEISYTKLCQKVGTGRKQIASALKELLLSGFVIKEKRYKRCNLYWIGQKWFTGEYR